MTHSVLTTESTLTDRYQTTILGGFLGLQAQDMTAQPQNLRALTPELQEGMQDLVADLDVDMDAPLSDEDEA